MAIPIALQLYTFREVLASDWRSVLKAIANLGYAGVETAGFDYAPVKEVRQQLDDLGLPVIAAHAPLPLGPEKNRVLDTMGTLGCQRLIFAGTGRDQFDSPGKIRARADLFNEANAVARAHGLEFGLHNHWWEFQQVGSRLAIELLLDDLEGSVFLELDAYWAVTAGADVHDFIRRHAPRMPLLHLKDGPCQRDVPQVAIGAGRMDFPALLPAASHAEWLVVELDECDTDLMAAVAESYRYLVDEGLGRGQT